MNKKIFVMLYVCLLGAISMTSCIDNKESESVTNIREAKAEQLKALAALSDAQAQAAKILAQAQATQAQAEALLAQANAELIATKAEEQRLANELLALQIAYEKALQYAKEEAELAKYRAQIAEAEARVAQAQADAIDAQRRKAYAEQLIQENELRFQQEMLQLQLALEQTKINYEKDLNNVKDAATRAELIRLTNNYNDAMSYVQYYQELLVNAKNNLLRYKNGITSSSTTMQTSIAEYNNDIKNNKDIIARAEEKIAYLKKYYNSTSDLETKMRKLESDKLAKDEAKRLAQTAASTALTAANEKYNKTNTYSFVNDIRQLDWYQIANNAKHYYSSSYYYDYEKQKGHSINSKLAQYLTKASLTVNYESVPVKYGVSIWVDSVTILVEKPIDFDKTVAKNIYNLENADLQKQIDDLSEIRNRNDSAANALADSIVVLDKIIETKPDSIINGMLVSDVRNQVYNEMNDNRTSAINVQNYIEEYDTQKKDLKYLYDTCIEFNSFVSSLTQKINNYNKSLKNIYSDYLTLRDKAIAAEKAYNTIYNEYSIISSLFYNANSSSIEYSLQEQEYIINSAKVKIQEDELAIKELQTKWETIDWETYYNDLIAGYELEIELWQKRAEEAKAELDAAIKGEPAPAPTPDPTPEQGNDSGTSDEGTDSDNSSDDEAE